MDPLNWTAFQALSDLGVPIKIAQHVTVPKVMATWATQKPKEFGEGIKTPKTATSRSVRNADNVLKRRTMDQRIQKPTRTPLTNSFIRMSDIGEARKRKEVVTNEKKTLAVSIAELVSIVQKLLSASSALGLCRPKACLEWLDLLPESHYNTGTVLSLAARACFERHDYIKAIELFKKIRQLDPLRLESMDVYGTCLWHLKKTVELSFLGKQLEEVDRLAPQTWCVIGNYFSLLQDHDAAIQAFKRAIQVDPYFTYGHTLLGHEHLSNEDLEASGRSFQTALRINPRHYNAIFGLGLIEKKQEKYLLAEHYFKQALAINPNNPILLDSLASVCHH
jgi:tetratricopeptide (TPR) repeat protein